jgi:hypothetical protein
VSGFVLPSGFLDRLATTLAAHYTDYEIVLVDARPAAPDSAEIRAKLGELNGLRTLRLSGRVSLDMATGVGLETTIGDFVVTLNPVTDPPEHIPAMVTLAGEGAGLVVGVNVKPVRRPWVAEALAAAFHWYARKFLGVDLVPHSTDFRVLSRRIVNAMMGVKTRYLQIRFLASTIGSGAATFRYTPNPDARDPMEQRGFWSMASAAADMIIANSTHPLRFVSATGLLAAGLNLLYMAYVVVVYLMKRDVAPGWTTLSLQVSVMFFLLFLLLVVLSEYVGRILAETRSVPLYSILDESTSSVLLHDMKQRRNVVEESR